MHKKKALTVIILCFLIRLNSNSVELHPSLFFWSADIPALQAKILTSPYSSRWNTIKNGASGGGLAYKGFVYLMTGDATQLASVKNALLGTLTKYTGWDGPYFGGSVMAEYAMAYDFIAKGLTPAEDAQIRENLANLFAYYFEGFWASADGSYLGGDYPAAVNLRNRLIGGAGLLALAMREYTSIKYGNAADWLKFVKDDAFGNHQGAASGWPIPGTPPYSSYSEHAKAAPYVDAMISPDGVYKEGPSYLEDSYVLWYFPLALDHINATSYIKYPSFYNVPLAHMYLSMPDGNQPTFDTGFRGKSVQFLEVLAPNYPNGEELMWFWANKEGSKVTDPILFLCYYNSNLMSSAHAPAQTTTFLKEGGYAVFRSGWNSTDTYMLLLSEHLPDYSCHETPDQTSFMIYAKGTFMAIDPGDGRGYLSDACAIGEPRTAKSHNLIIVDDTESPGIGSGYTGVKDPANLQNFFTTSFHDYAETQMHYSAVNVDLIRKVLFVNKEYFVMADDLSSAAQHTYDWQLHFGLNTGLVVTGNQAVWTSGTATQLRVYFANPNVSITTYTGRTNYYSGQTFDHTYIKARTTGSQTQYLTVLYPRSISAADPTINKVTVSGGGAGVNVGLGTRKETILCQQAGSIISGDNVTTDGKLAMVSKGADSLLSVFIEEGTKIAIPGQDILTSSLKLNAAAIKYESDKIKGYILGPSSGSSDVTVYTQGVIPQYVSFKGNNVNFTRTNNLIRFTIQGSGALGVNENTSLRIRDNSFYKNNSNALSLFIHNSMNGAIKINYSVPASGRIRVNIYNHTGELIRTLVNAQMPAGTYTATWDAKANNGQTLTNGVYYCHLLSGNIGCTKKILIVR